MTGDGERFGRLRRVRLVVEDKRRMAEWELAAAREEEERLRRNEVELLETLGSQSLMQGLFLEGKAQALRRIGAEIGRAAAVREGAETALGEAARTEKHVARAESEAGARARAAEEGRSLAALLDERLAVASFE